MNLFMERLMKQNISKETRPQNLHVLKIMEELTEVSYRIVLRKMQLTFLSIP